MSRCLQFHKHRGWATHTRRYPTVAQVFLGTSGLKVSPLCLGTMNFGGAATTQCSEAEAHAILDAYVAAGGNFIDTADVYQKGESERILGRWLAKNAALRSKLVIASKVRGAVDPSTAGPNDVGLSRSHIMAAVDESLARLGISHIDLYQCHVWDAGTPLAETLRALDDLTKAGKIRYHGWSNVTGYQAMKIMSECARLGLSPPVSISSQYSLLCRQTEWEVLPVCEGEGIAMLPWSPQKGEGVSCSVMQLAAPIITLLFHPPQEGGSPASLRAIRLRRLRAHASLGRRRRGARCRAPPGSQSSRMSTRGRLSTRCRRLLRAQAAPWHKPPSSGSYTSAPLHQWSWAPRASRNSMTTSARHA